MHQSRELKCEELTDALDWLEVAQECLLEENSGLRQVFASLSEAFEWLDTAYGTARAVHSHLLKSNPQLTEVPTWAADVRTLLMQAFLRLAEALKLKLKENPQLRFVLPRTKLLEEHERKGGRRSSERGSGCKKNTCAVRWRRRK